MIRLNFGCNISGDNVTSNVSHFALQFLPGKPDMLHLEYDMHTTCTFIEIIDSVMYVRLCVSSCFEVSS